MAFDRTAQPPANKAAELLDRSAGRCDDVTGPTLSKRDCSLVTHLTRHTRNLTVYKPDLEDRARYTTLPVIAYGAIATAAIMLIHAPVEALFAVAAGVLLVIFVGIHNSWDIVRFIAAGGHSQRYGQRISF